MQKYSDLKKYYHFSQPSAAVSPVSPYSSPILPPSSAAASPTKATSPTVYSPLSRQSAYQEGAGNYAASNPQNEGSRQIFTIILVIIALGSLFYIRDQALNNKDSVYYDIYNVLSARFAIFSLSPLTFPKARSFSVAGNNNAILPPQLSPSAQLEGPDANVGTVFPPTSPPSSIEAAQQPSAATSQQLAAPQPPQQHPAAQPPTQATQSTQSALLSQVPPTTLTVPQAPPAAPVQPLAQLGSGESISPEPRQTIIPGRAPAPLTATAPQHATPPLLQKTPSTVASPQQAIQAQPQLQPKETFIREENGTIISQISPPVQNSLPRRNVATPPAVASSPQSAQLPPPPPARPTARAQQSLAPSAPISAAPSNVPQQRALALEAGAAVKTPAPVNRSQAATAAQTNQLKTLPTTLRRMYLFVPILKADKGTVRLVKQAIPFKTPARTKAKLFLAAVNAIVAANYNDLGGLDFFPERIKVNKVRIENKTLIIDVNRAFEYSRYGRKALAVRLQLLLWGTLIFNDQLFPQENAIEFVSLLIDGQRKRKLGGDGWVLNPFYSASDLQTQISFLAD